MERPQKPIPWHAIPLPELHQKLDSDDAGLSLAEARARLDTYGPNVLPESPSPTPARIFLRQFSSPLIYVLLVAAVVSLFIGEYRDAGFIVAVLLINAIVGGTQEWKAERSSAALRKLIETHATVQRDGDTLSIPADQVVPGDIVWLESGDRVPADLRLLNAHGLEIDESLLTGESLPVFKDAAWRGDESVAPAECLNMCFAGSIATHGRGKGLVVATGAATGVGQLALDVTAGSAGKPPLLQRMERFTNVIAVATVLTALLIGLIGIGTGRYALTEMFLFVVAMAVSAIPEGLPVAMTVALAVGTTRMARRGAIVRRLAAVEGLGSCTMIATDKTGTLTVNELTVQEIRLPDGDVYRVTGAGFSPEGGVFCGERLIARGEQPALDALIRAGTLCNEASLYQREGEWEWRGDAVDVALLSLAHKVGASGETAMDRYPRINEIPFESEHQYAATFNRVDGQVRVFVKGAPERVLAMSDAGSSRADIETAALEMAGRGYRVLALAEGPGASGADPSKAPGEPRTLTFLGLVGMVDPLRTGAREAIEVCHDAGVAVCMITGDHAVTALAIAQELGLADNENEVITGPELAAQPAERLPQLISRYKVFARVAPRQKLDIVNAACASGHFVAVTGDGVNDAPALRAANIGVAMGKSGTDVARDAAELVISDDNFATIVAGVIEGRVAYDNIRKVIYLLISTGAAELAMMALGIAAGTPLPLLPVQILWLNLVTNGVQDVALAFEPGEGDALNRKPRAPKERIFNRLMIERTIVGGLVMGGIGFAAFDWMLRNGWTVEASRNALLLLMVLFENFHLGNCRSETKSAFSASPLRSPLLLLGALAALGIHLASMYLPFMQNVLGVHPVSIGTWLVVVVAAAMIVPAMELHKWTWRHRYPAAQRES